MDTLIDKFIKHLQTWRRHSGNTIKSYERDLFLFKKYCYDNNIFDINKIPSKTIEKFIGKLKTKNIKNNSIRRYLSSLSSFYQYLIDESISTYNPVVSVRSPSLDFLLKKTISFEQIENIISYLKTTSYPMRNVAIVEVFYSTGIRLSELVGLNVEDIYTKQGFIRIYAKGGKIRFTPIGNNTLKLIKQYIKSKSISCDNALFTSKNGSRISARMVQKILAKCNKIVGVNIHPHLFRHSAASHFLQSSHDLISVKEFLGHKSIKSTQVYTHLDYLHLAEIHDKYHPHAQNKSDKN